MKETLAAGCLLVRTIDYRCQSGGSLPTAGSTTLVWPHRHMMLMGSNTRRLGVLYDLKVTTSRRATARMHAPPTQPTTHPTQQPSPWMRQLLRDARPGQHMLYSKSFLFIIQLQYEFTIVGYQQRVPSGYPLVTLGLPSVYPLVTNLLPTH